MTKDNATKRGGLLRGVIRLIGFLLLGLSLAYIAREVARYWPEIAQWRPGAAELLSLFVLALIYALMLYILAEVWHRLVTIFGPEPRARTWRSYTLTQIARYLPGNFAHLIGRAAVLQGGLLSPGQLGLATGLELVIVPAGAMTALLIAVPFIPISTYIIEPMRLPFNENSLTVVCCIILVIGTVCLILIGHRLAGGRKFLATILVALPLCTLFMTSLGAVFGAIVGMVSGGHFLISAVAGVVAWLVGYATPGAPGGLGSREATLVFLLSSLITSSELIIAVALFRLVTIAGDLICFTIGVIFLRVSDVSGSASGTG
jgi:uncharacterized membrane protein YbhN (UPF0104 family)